MSHVTKSHSRIGFGAAAALALALLTTPCQANPATVDYRCRPALPKGDRISIDYNSGGKSARIEFPNGEAVRLAIQPSGSGFRYSGGNVAIAGKGDALTLDVQGQPSRNCNAVNN